MSPEHVVVVPSTLLLLPEYAGIEDPLPELRAAVRDAVTWLVERHPDEVAVLCGEPRPDDAARGVAHPAGARIARQLLDETGFDGQLVDRASGMLVVASGTARRSEKAPGHLDERSFAYDEVVDTALRKGDVERLRDLDVSLGEELLAHDAPVLRELGERVAGDVVGEVDLTDDPYGVQYWVVRWTCES